MKAFLVDDEPLARQRMRSLLEHCGAEVEILGESGSASEAVDVINKAKPDVLFLDIEMPGLDGFDLVSLLEPPIPQVIFVTAYDHYAIKAFDIFALDYLTKPVRIDRLKKSIERLKNVTTASESRQSVQNMLEDRKKQPLQVLTAKRGRSLKIISVDDIHSVVADDKLVYAHTADQKWRIDTTLDSLLERLDQSVFIRIHRSAIVNARRVQELIPWFSGTYEVRLENGQQLGVSRRRVREVKKALGMT